MRDSDLKASGVVGTTAKYKGMACSGEICDSAGTIKFKYAAHAPTARWIKSVPAETVRAML